MKYIWLFLICIAFKPADRHLLFDQLQQRLPGNLCEDTKIYENDKRTKGRITFLNREFRTQYFAAATSVRYFECEDRRFHLGMISMEFKNQQDAELAFAAITSTSRTSFRLPTPNRFAPKRLGNEIVILYSETFTDLRFQDLVNKN
jgi:hypothetical protein